MTTTPATTTTQTIQLTPKYGIPLVLLIGAVPLLVVQPWIGLVVEVFALFLVYQTATIRLQFTDTALEVYRSGNLIRRFPYQEWLNWEIFWPPVPILFYFREVKSIHFLPVLFDPKMLQQCLEERCPRQND